MNQGTEECRDVVLDSINEGVFTVDLDWRITAFNRAAERITGVSRQQAIGQKCFDVFHANICQGECVLHETIESGREVISRPINILNSHGEVVPVSISTAVLRDERGEVVGGVETFRDMSAIELLRKLDDRRSADELVDMLDAALASADEEPADE